MSIPATPLCKHCLSVVDTSKAISDAEGALYCSPDCAIGSYLSGVSKGFADTTTKGDDYHLNLGMQEAARANHYKALQVKALQVKVKMMRSYIDQQDNRIQELIKAANEASELHMRLQEHQKMDARIMHNQIISMQAALIAARTNGAEVGMQWIENALCGPDLLPDEDDPHYHDAQAYRNYYDYDAVIERENQEAPTEAVGSALDHHYPGTNPAEFVYHYHATYQTGGGVRADIDGIAQLSYEIKDMEGYRKLKSMIEPELEPRLTITSLSLLGRLSDTSAVKQQRDELLVVRDSHIAKLNGWIGELERENCKLRFRGEYIEVRELARMAMRLLDGDEGSSE